MGERGEFVAPSDQICHEGVSVIADAQHICGFVGARLVGAILDSLLTRHLGGLESESEARVQVRFFRSRCP